MIRRDAGYRHPDIEQVCQTLNGGTPANAADLAALLMDRLEELALDIRRGNTDDWRQYWNEPHGQSPTAKHEDHCRDALLSALRHRLPEGVDAQPEGHYANDKRADIRVSCGDFQVPVEIKKNMHRDLWSALRNQLIVQVHHRPGLRRLRHLPCILVRQERHPAPALRPAARLPPRSCKSGCKPPCPPSKRARSRSVSST